MQPENKISMDVSSKNTDPISFFNKDADFVFVYKKTEKLASAIYMVTSLFSENEPMKWTLRKKISELVSLTIGYKDTSESTRLDLSYSIRTKVLELVSLLEVSMHGGLVSQMNFSVLKQEFLNVTNALNSHSVNQFDLAKSNISKSFFEVGNSVPALSERTVSETHKTIHNYQVPTSDVESKKTFSDDLKDTAFSPSKEELKRSNRQNVILSLIRKKRELTIKDIAEVIKDVSEKTIQRELNSFIEAGVLKRTGVRRWSKYSLA